MDQKYYILIIIVVALAVAIGGAYWFFTGSYTLSPDGNQSPAPVYEIPAQGNSAEPTPAKTAAAAPGPVAATCTASIAATGTDAIYVAGSVTETDSGGHRQTFANTCADGTHLEQYICYESPAGSDHYAAGRTIVTCANGCENGTCKK